MMRYISVLDGHTLRFCTKCNSVWENPYEQPNIILLVKYSALCSYKLPRIKCLTCRKGDYEIYNNNDSRELVTRYY